MLDFWSDPRSLLQVWRQSRYDIRLQHRELQAVEVRGRRTYGNGKSEIITAGTAW